MIYDINHFPKTFKEAQGFRLATFEEVENDGTAMTYDEQEFNAYKHELLNLVRDMDSEDHSIMTNTDEDGVYLEIS